MLKAGRSRRQEASGQGVGRLRARPFSMLHLGSCGCPPGTHLVEVMEVHMRWGLAGARVFSQEVGLNLQLRHLLGPGHKQVGPISSLFIPEPFIGNLLCARLQPT